MLLNNWGLPKRKKLIAIYKCLNCNTKLEKVIAARKIFKKKIRIDEHLIMHLCETTDEFQTIGILMLVAIKYKLFGDIQ